MALCNYGCNSVCGIHTACVSQVPASEVVIQPPAFCVTIPGAILSASPEPVAVSGHNPCATTSCCDPCGYGYGRWCGYGYGSRRWGTNAACSYPYSCYGYKCCY